jgi:hypothetical protein
VPEPSSGVTPPQKPPKETIFLVFSAHAIMNQIRHRLTFIARMLSTFGPKVALIAKKTNKKVYSIA